MTLLFQTAVVLFCTRAAMAADYYPEVRALLREAVEASAGITRFPDRSNPLERAAQLFARAGYLDDAIRTATRAGVPTEQFAAAMTLYGDLAGAKKSLDALRDPDRKAVYLTVVAKVLWRMGDRENAGQILADAERICAQIPLAARRKARLQLVQQLREALPEEPPIPLSPEPAPQARPSASSPIPAFPITAEGFRRRDPAVTSQDASKNEAFLTTLYALAAGGDRAALAQHTKTASSPFQKTLALASLEHILIQVDSPELAEPYAREIPDDRSDCTLAKAEALKAVAAAWARIGNTDQAHRCFNDALQALGTVNLDLAFGKVIVAASIAATQARAGLVATGGNTFEVALRIVSDVPLRPKPVNGVYPKEYFQHHFRNDAFRAVFAAAIQIHDLAAARRSAESWRASCGPDADGEIVDAWLVAGRKQDAITQARAIEQQMPRASALLGLAHSLLEEAGAPVF